MKKYPLIILLFLLSKVVAGQILTLQSCLERGIEQNFSVRIVKADQQISSNNATRSAAGALPVLSATSGYNLTLDDNWYLERESFEKSSSSGVFNQRVNVGLALNWTVFDGFKVQTNYKRLLELEKIGEVNTRIAIEDLIASLTAEYYNYIQQSIRLNNFNYAVALSKERLRIVEERYAIGSFSLLEVQQARVYFNADSSKYMSQQTTLHASRIKLNQLMANQNVDEPIVVLDSIVAINENLDYGNLYGQTLESNSLLVKATYNKSLADLNLKTVLARNYPYVRLSTGYGYGLNLYNRGTNSHSQTLGFDGGVSVGITIFDGSRKRERKNALLEIDKVELRKQEVIQSLKANLSNFWQAYLTNIEVVKLEVQNLFTAKENYTIAMERYMLGNLSGIEMREAQKSLLDAEERLLSAQYTTKLCEISLLQISGRVFEYLTQPL